MSKERLEEIKEIRRNMEEFVDSDGCVVDYPRYDELALFIIDDYLDYLIEQAERVQELEKNLKEQIASNWELDKINRKWLQQNKRYRETLWDINIKLRDLFVEVWDMDNGELQGKFYKMSKIIQNELEESE